MIEFHSLNQTAIKQEVQGRSDHYYQLFEHLGDYSQEIFEHLGIQPLSVQVKSGEMGAVLITKTHSEHIVLKVYVPGTNIYAVNYFYEKLDQLNIPAPKPMSFDNSQKIVPFDFQLMTYVPGCELIELDSKYRHQGGVLMGENIAKVHSIKTLGFGSPTSSGEWSHQSWLDSLEQEYGFEIKKGADLVFTSEEQDTVESLTLRNDRLEIDEGMLIHCDVGDRNGLYTVGDNHLQLEGIIDPGVMQGGDPMFDLANVLSNENDFSEGFKKGYLGAKRLSDYEEYRLLHLQLFCSYWTACWQAITSQDFGKKKAQVMRLLEILNHNY